MTSQRPRILLITRNLPPLVGGMERLNWHIADELSRYADVQVIGPVGSAALGPKSVQFTEVPLRPLSKFLISSLSQTLRISRDWKPDLILAGSGLTAPMAYFGAKVAQSRSAAYIHGLDITVQHFAYQKIWLPFIRRMNTIIVNSSPTRALALDARISPKCIHIVPPGVGLPEQAISDIAKQIFLNKNGLQEKSILLSVGRFTSRKGLREFIQQALPQISQACPDVMLVIIGDAPSQALSADVQTPQSILATAQDAGVAQHVQLLGVVDEATLQAAFSCAALHIFPIRLIPGDPEGFGMVAIEAASYGVPTVAFATGGVVDAVAPGQSGHLVAPGDYPALAQAVLQVLADQPAVWQSNATAFAQNFAWPAFGTKLNAALQDPASSTSCAA